MVKSMAFSLQVTVTSRHILQVKARQS